MTPSLLPESDEKQGVGEHGLERHPKVYQNAGFEKDDDSRQSLENHSKIDKLRRFSNKKFVSR